MQKPTFSLDCDDAAEQAEHLDLPSCDLLEVETFHLLGVMGGVLIVCVHTTDDETHQFAMPEAVRDCLPEEDDLANHFQRLLRAEHN